MNKNITVFIIIILSICCLNGLLTKSVAKPLACNGFNIDDKNIIVIGDIHGDKEALVEILQREKIIDQNQNWINNDKIIVQVGDVVDRGPQSLEALELLRYIQSKGKPGQVIRIIGNHELMLIMGDWGYINRDYDTPEKIDKIISIIKEDISNGRMLAAYSLGNIIFSHAGISQKFIDEIDMNSKNSDEIVDFINQKVKDIINSYCFDGQICNYNQKCHIANGKKYCNNYYHYNEIFGSNSIFWFRSNSVKDDFIPSNKFLQIIGHTIKDKITVSPDFGAIYVDVGMSSSNNIGYLNIVNNMILSKNMKNNEWKTENIQDIFCKKSSTY